MYELAPLRPRIRPSPYVCVLYDFCVSGPGSIVSLTRSRVFCEGGFEEETGRERVTDAFLGFETVGRGF